MKLTFAIYGKYLLPDPNPKACGRSPSQVPTPESSSSDRRRSLFRMLDVNTRIDLGLATLE